MTRPVVDFLFDVGSPATYLAWARLPGIAARTGADIRWRPILLGAVFQATGNTSPAAVKAKGRYLMADLTRFAEKAGTPFRFNPHFPINTLTMQRGAVAALADGRIEAYLAAIFPALWADGRDMGNPEVLGAVLEAAGFDAAALIAACATPEVKDRLKAETEQAVARGVFGAPSFFVGDTLYFGQDRLDFVEEALARQAAA